MPRYYIIFDSVTPCVPTNSRVCSFAHPMFSKIFWMPTLSEFIIFKVCMKSFSSSLLAKTPLYLSFRGRCLPCVGYGIGSAPILSLNFWMFSCFDFSSSASFYFHDSISFSTFPISSSSLSFSAIISLMKLNLE